MKPVAIQLFSLRDEMKDDVVGTLKRVKELGYDGVEFAGLWGKTPEEMAELVGELGLVPISAHIPIGDLRKDALGVIECFKRVGCKHVVIPWLDEIDRPKSESWENTKADFERIGKIAAENQMSLSYHNHGFEFEPLQNGVLGFDNLFDSISPDLLKMQQDVCWVHHAGHSPEKYLEKYKNRCPLLHLKDYSRENGEFGFRPVGHGEIDFVSIIETAEKCGVEWYIVEQDRPTTGKTPFECAEMSIKYIKELNK